MSDERFVATCICPVCGQRAKHVALMVWDDSPYLHQWRCYCCDKTYRGDRFRIILSAHALEAAQRAVAKMMEVERE